MDVERLSTSIQYSTIKKLCLTETLYVYSFSCRKQNGDTSPEKKSAETLLSTVTSLWMTTSEWNAKLSCYTYAYKYRTNCLKVSAPLNLGTTYRCVYQISIICKVRITQHYEYYIRGSYRKSWATFFFCMRTGNSRRRRVQW